MKLRSAWRLALPIAVTGFLYAQGAGVHRTVLQKKDLSIPGHEAVVARVEIDPGSSVGRHTHPGEEISYILDGQADILIEGQAPLHVKAGDSFVVPAGAKHDARNTGSAPMHLVAVYVVEKGKPVATPAP
jgi:quercetin dioxygenase-like cupin family protein